MTYSIEPLIIIESLQLNLSTKPNKYQKDLLITQNKTKAKESKTIEV